MKVKGPLFIVGVGRSGTSLLQSIMSSHTQISIVPETGFLRNACLGWSRHENVSMEEMSKSFPRLERIKKKLPPDLHNQKFSDELALYRFILESIRKKYKKEVTGDKDPKLVEYISVVSKLFPDGKFIHLVRDPRDVLLSKKKAQWSKDKPSWYHIFANYVQLRLGEYAGKKIPADQYFVVTYESVLDSPVKTIWRMCQFAEVEFETSMLAFQKKARELVADNEMQWKKKTMGPLLKNNTGKWKGKLGTREVALTECLCKKAFDIGHYKKSNAIDSLMGTNKLFINVISFTFKGLGSIYMLYVLILQNLLMIWKR